MPQASIRRERERSVILAHLVGYGRYLRNSAIVYSTLTAGRFKGALSEPDELPVCPVTGGH